MAMQIDSKREGFDGFSECLKLTYINLCKRGEITLTPDCIAYTEEFNRIFRHMALRFPCIENDVFKTLINLRKAGEFDGLWPKTKRSKNAIKGQLV